MEELCHEEKEMKQIEEACDIMPMPMSLPDPKNTWGEYFIHDTEKPNKNYFVD